MPETATQERLTFDHASHSYFWDGKKVPGVNEILDVVFDRHYTGDPWYGERGSAVHLATKYLDEGVLDPTSVDPQIVPYVESYKQFLIDKKPECVLIETPLYSEMHGFAGTIDRVWKIENRRMIGDLKTGSPKKDDEYQLWGYDILYNENFKDAPAHDRAALYLKPPKYRLRDKSERGAFKFLALLETYHLKMERGWKPGVLGQ